ncbi:hypothetical protein [Janthinobacterium fluminis]|uniref:Aspartyl protease n=1 Tax=Janthinobacterium fluminis TaxID=2987524 RepID=A0ABT5JZ97_9BURK|nr:hypothetical protein [Janthinobacterium fluminis]MDC8757483.1 hypothetical protein [Janthinobacterium fluminis]
MQLDTGAGLSSLYRDALPRRYRSALNADSIVIERFELADVASRSFKLMYTATRRTSNSCGARPRSRLAGTIANDYLLDKRLTLDLGRGLFRIEQGPFSPAEGQQHTSAPLEILTTENQGSFPVIKTVLGSGEEWKMGFDTGSASTSLVILSKKDWLNLVGLKSPEEAMSELVSRWGQQVPCYSAPIRTPIFVGTFKIDSKAEAVYCDDPRADPSAPNPIAGFIGLAPFGQGGVTIDYIGKNLYIFPRSDDAANSQKQK